MKNKIFCLGIFVLFFHSAFSQCLPGPLPFREGEKITYVAAYNWGPVWVDAGEVTFTVETAEYRGQNAFHFRSTGKTFKGYDVLFKVRDYYDSWVHPETFKSFEFRRQIYEGGYMLNNNILFFHQLGYALANTKRPNNPIKTDTLRLRTCYFDMLSSIYYTRSLDLQNLSKEVPVPITVLIDDSLFQIKIRRLGEEVVENRDGNRYRCIKVSATMVKGTIFKEDEEVIIWLTDDENKIPILVEAKILVGTVKAYLKEAKGLKSPLVRM